MGGTPAVSRGVSIQSDLYRGSGCNPIDPDKVERYTRQMEDMGGWGRFPPVRGYIQEVDEENVETFDEAAEDGYERELDWSRALEDEDIGLEYAQIDDGHHRAWAARSLGIPIRIEEWP